MRNPVRLKNFRSRFIPAYALGGALLLFSEPTRLGFLLGLPVLLCGAALRAWGAGHLVKSEELCTTGPYAHLRHPLYAGTLLIATGFSLLLWGWTGILLFAGSASWFGFLYYPRKDRLEGVRLGRLYGETYRAYRDGVPGLVPRREPWRSPGMDSRRRWRRERFVDNNELGTWLALVAGVLLVTGRAVLGP